MISEKEYRFLSPSFMAMEGTKEIVRILGAGLVHRPCMELKALANESEDNMNANPNELGRVSEALGLQVDASIDDILTEIRKKQEVDPEQYVPISAVKDLLKKTTEVAETASMNATTQKVETAMRAGYLTPAMKNWAIALCSQSPQAFDEFMASTGPQYSHLFKEYDFSGAQEALDAHQQSSGADIDSISTQLGVCPEALT
jgi:phage I-like protein